MNAAAPRVVALAGARRVDPLDALIERAGARAYLWSIGEYELHEAVDQLEADARRDGLNRRIGIDGLQRILADAFEPYREQTTVDTLPEIATDELMSQLAASTIEAFAYLLTLSNPDRLRTWLARRRPDERTALRKLLIAK
jgi:hypothetical protein